MLDKNNSSNETSEPNLRDKFPARDLVPIAANFLAYYKQDSNSPNSQIREREVKFNFANRLQRQDDEGTRNPLNQEDERVFRVNSILKTPMIEGDEKALRDNVTQSN